MLYGVRRFYLIALLLIGSLVLVGFLAWQAHLAVRSHRESAESVLRDYATLASGEFVRRTLTEVGYYGYFPLIGAIQSWSAANPGTAPIDLADLEMREDQARARELGAYIFRFHGGTGRLEAPAAELSEKERSTLERVLSARLPTTPTDGSYVTIFETVGGTIRSFVFMPALPGEETPRALVGFEANLGVLDGWIARAVGRGPLMPPSLSEGDLENDSIFLDVRLTSGEVLYEQGEPFDPWYGVETPFGEDYRGMLEEVVVRLAIDPAVAPQLVIGGLPRSRVPLLLGVLAVVAGLVAIAILQLDRERALVRLRSDFVSRVSHELRTPLTQIRMFAETLLLDRVRTGQERQRALEVIDRESRRLSHLVENVLQFSRSEHDSIQLALEPRRLRGLLTELVEEFDPLLDGSKASVVTRLEDDSEVSVDADAMRQIVLNLLENAVKYGPEEQEVLLGTSRENGRVRVWVDDQGPGIRSADRERIWEPFQRVDPEPGSALTGTGIGLSVVRDLIGRHGGRSWVEDGSRGGARFVVELPRSDEVPG